MDVNEEKLKGEVLDLNHGNLFLSGVKIEGGGGIMQPETLLFMFYGNPEI